MTIQAIHNSMELIELIDHIEFLSLYSGIHGFYTKDMVENDCQIKQKILSHVKKCVTLPRY